MSNTAIYCERCGEKLNPNKVKWLELSNTDGRYYTKIPDGHVSQGEFSFGSACAKAEINNTNNLQLNSPA